MALKKHNPGCNCCDCATACAICADGSPDTIALTLAVNDNGCNCQDLNGTFILTYACGEAVTGSTYTDYCVWRLLTTMLCGTGDQRDVEFLLTLFRYTDFLGRVAHFWQLHVYVENSGGSDDDYQFVKDMPYGQTVNCQSQINMTLNFYIGYLCTPVSAVLNLGA